jgi:hypothetical protein
VAPYHEYQGLKWHAVTTVVQGINAAALAPKRHWLPPPLPDRLLPRSGAMSMLQGCAEGRSAATWVDWNFYGHQVGLPAA